MVGRQDVRGSCRVWWLRAWPRGRALCAYVLRRPGKHVWFPLYCAVQASTACSRAAPPRRASSPPISFAIGYAGPVNIKPSSSRRALLR
ncbi:MAG: hypothetical protein ACK56I_04360, partial [bacterium]